eukprot:g2799.t1
MSYLPRQKKLTCDKKEEAETNDVKQRYYVSQEEERGSSKKKTHTHIVALFRAPLYNASTKMASQYIGLLVFTVSCFLSTSSADHEKNSPVALNSSFVHSGRLVRFTILTERLIRIERKKSLAEDFDNRATFAIANRHIPNAPPFKISRTDNTTTIEIKTELSWLKVTHFIPEDEVLREGLSDGEIMIEMFDAPYPKPWVSLATTKRTQPTWKSSVAHIAATNDPLNLNGTMNYGPAFAGGLDCYSTPPACERAYHETIGQGLISRTGYTIIDDTNNTRLEPLEPMENPATMWPPQWFNPSSTREASHRLTDDLYFLYSPQLDYKRALSDFALVSGPPSLPPKQALGVWYSRYFPYGEETYFSDVLDKYKEYALPLSVGVLDVPWHTIEFSKYDLPTGKNTSYPYLPITPGVAKPGTECNGWDGYTFNKTLFPDPLRFFNRTRDRGIKMILSVHMQNGIDHCQDAYYVSFAKAMGFSDVDIANNKTIPCEMDNVTFVDTFFRIIADAKIFTDAENWWWLDYPGGASNISGWNQQEPASLYWGNRMFAEYARNVKKRRPVILARYGGLGQQRDGLGFSGDTFQSFGTLAFEVSMTPKASNVLFSWWSHDIGGNHNSGYSGYEPGTKKPIPPAYPGDENPSNTTGSEMLLRWIQFGVFSPILRTHCEPSCDRYVWEFANDFNDIRAALRLRDALVPYIYTSGRIAFDTGISLLRPMYYEFPYLEESYSFAETQYFFGSPNIFVAPITSMSSNVTHFAEKEVWFPEEGVRAPPEGEDTSMENNQEVIQWLDFVTGRVINKSKTLWHKSEIPAFVRDGTIIPTRDPDDNDVIVWIVWVCADDNVATSRQDLRVQRSGSGVLYEDAGDGLDYLKDPPLSSRDARQYSSVTHTSLKISESNITFKIDPVIGGSLKSAMRHRIQIRGMEGVTVKGTTLNGRKIPFHWTSPSEDGRNALTEPSGSFIVECGLVSTNIRTNIVIELDDELKKI